MPVILARRTNAQLVASLILSDNDCRDWNALTSRRVNIRFRGRPSGVTNLPRQQSRGDADEFDVLRGALFHITPYRYF